MTSFELSNCRTEERTEADQGIVVNFSASNSEIGYTFQTFRKDYKAV